LKVPVIEILDLNALVLLTTISDDG